MNTLTESNIHRGMMIFQNKCQRCHTIRKGETARDGPNLFGVFGRVAASTKFYGHSEQLTKSQIIWNRPNLERYLKNPKHHSKVPGNVMFHGAAVPASAHLVVSYLESISPKASISTPKKSIPFNINEFSIMALSTNQIPPMIPLTWQLTGIDPDVISDLDTRALYEPINTNILQIESSGLLTMSQLVKSGNSGRTMKKEI